MSVGTFARLAFLSLALVFSLASGGAALPVQMIPGAEQVRIGTGDPPPEDIELGPIEASHGHGCGMFGEAGTYEGAYTAIKNEAAHRGATYVKIMQQVPPHSENGCGVNAFVIRGIAYRQR